MTRVTPKFSVSNVRKSSAVSANKRGKFLPTGMKTVKDALKDLTDAPLPTPNMLEWLEEWEEMNRESESWALAAEAETTVPLTTKGDLQALRASVNIYLFSRINRPTGDVLTPLRNAMNAEDVRTAIKNVEGMIS
ncbi:MAG: hypothetical protein MRY59_04255 [Aquisalinus sp.]|nr:hypothetical protein [Aquisalinus sp.]